MSEGDYLDEDGNSHSGAEGSQKQPPTPTPAPTPPFHDDLSTTMATLSTTGRGFGDPRLNAMLPSLFYQAEAKIRSLEEALFRLNGQKDSAQSDANGLRIQLATLEGQLETLRREKALLESEKSSDSRITKLALTLTTLLGPFAFGLMPDKLGIGLGLLGVAVICLAVGLRPSLFKIFEKGSK